MQVIKLEVIVIDLDGVGASGVRDAIENARYPNRCISPQVKAMAVREIGEWRDDHPLNSSNTADAELARLFAAGNHVDGTSGEAPPTEGFAESDGWDALERYRAEMLDDQRRLTKLAANFLELGALEGAAQCTIKAAGLTQVIGRLPQRPPGLRVATLPEAKPSRIVEPNA